MATPACNAPLAFSTLVEYWLGDLDAAAEERVEEHLFACGECSGRLAEVVALGNGVRAAFAHGTVSAFLADAFVRRLGEQGMRVREYRVPRGGSVNCTVTSEDELVVAELEAPLEGINRLDAMLSSSAGAPAEAVLRDIPFNAASGMVVLASKLTELRARPSHQFRVRLVAVEPGAERVIGEYTFNHTAHPVRD